MMKIKKLELPGIEYSPRQNLEWQKLLFHQLFIQLKKNKFWKSTFPTKQCFANHNFHLAIFVEPYLSLILDGQKTIESRFSVNRCAPFQKTSKGDIVLLKRSGGPIIGICRIDEVWYYALNSSLWDEIRTTHAKALCIEDKNFWERKQKSNFGTLMKVSNATLFDLPIVFNKRDRRGWVVLSDNKTMESKLFD